MSESRPRETQDQAFTVLVVDDEEGVRDLIGILLEGEGYRTFTAGDGVEALEVIGKQGGQIDLVIQDLRMPRLGGTALLRQIRERLADVPVIIVTAYSTWDDAVEAMRLGAYDYIRKPFDTDSIRRLVRKALERRALLRETPGGEAGEYPEMVGSHPLIQNISELVQRVAPTDSTVLIQGESGTGKEIVARGIHLRSYRRAEPFVPVNCSAFTEALLQSELFGHVRGAFTGAVEDKKGLFHVASGGTLFLDEVADMSLTTQVKILRVLEERKVSRVGSTTLEPIDVRIIAATNKDIEHEVRDGNFREDLFYRLNVIPMFLPPLRDRKEDIPLLAGHFLAKYSKRLRKNVTGISQSALQSLLEYHWPGNVRELENIIQRHVALSEGATIEAVFIRRPEKSRDPARAEPAAVGEQALIPDGGIELDALLDDVERRYLKEALRQTKGHMTNAAKLLGMSYRSMRYKVKKLGVRDRDSVIG